MNAMVAVEGGRLEGVCEREIRRFLGVPYAAPPVGALRWRPPTPVEPWSGTRAARTFGPAALQAPRATLPLGTEAKSEDCLYLNIWTPLLDEAAGLPVMVWFHGGGYVSGAASEPVYDGAALAAQGMVVVTVNYRLHVFGYLAHPSIGANFGLQDQFAALAWVKRHARLFGGDPENITAAGESAGAGSVHALLSAPAGDALFHKAIMQSGGFNEFAGQHRRRTLADAHGVSQRLFAALGSDDPERLRAIPAETVWQCADDLTRFDLSTGQIVLPHHLPWAPVEDDEILPAGRAPHPRGSRPLLFGWNANEGRYFFRPGRQFTCEKLDYVATELCGLSPETVAGLFDTDAAEAVLDALDRLFSTVMGAETAVETATRMHSRGTAAYVYRFGRVSPGALRSGLLANHTADLPYMFGTLDRMDGGYEEADADLSASMLKAWASFARSGAPELDDGPWPRFDPADPRIALLDHGAVAAPFKPDALFLAVRAARG